MARKGSMRGRPGLIFLGVLVICLVIFYLSWKSLIVSAPKPAASNNLAEGRRFVSNVNDFGFQNNKDMSFHGNKIESKLQDDDWDPKEMDSKPDSNEKNKEKVEIEQEIPEDFETILKTRAKIFNKVQEQPVTEKKEEIPWYIKQISSLRNVVGNMEKIVHLDLKGAAPKVSYLIQLFPLLSKLGATGLLIEYEDMFPYSGVIKEIASDNAYKTEDIKQILLHAQQNNLKVIPLVQTFGHLEFVLKYSDKVLLRESDYTPQVIDSSSEASYNLISEMIKQVLELHPDATHIHIGCDEVYELGRGKSKDIIAKQKITKSSLFISHVSKVAEIVKQNKRKLGSVMPIIWDDHLRNMTEDDLETSNLADQVEIMIWYYRHNVSEVIPKRVWDMYSVIFESVWIASSFKGATGPRQFYTEAKHHLLNHINWLQTLSSMWDPSKGSLLQIAGFALTGWQRYDHFATLCELIPVAIPSLAVCLAALDNAGFDEAVHLEASKSLKCSNLIELDFPRIEKESKKAVVTQDCRFPGHEIYYLMQQYYGYWKTEEGVAVREAGWLSDYQIKHSFTSPGIMKSMVKTIRKKLSEYRQIRPLFERELLNIYCNDTVKEWLEENIDEKMRHNEDLLGKVESMLKIYAWPKRPLQDVTETTKRPELDKEKDLQPGVRDVGSQSQNLLNLKLDKGGLPSLQPIQNRLRIPSSNRGQSILTGDQQEYLRGKADILDSNKLLFRDEGYANQDNKRLEGIRNAALGQSDLSALYKRNESERQDSLVASNKLPPIVPRDGDTKPDLTNLGKKAEPGLKNVPPVVTSKNVDLMKSDDNNIDRLSGLRQPVSLNSGQNLPNSFMSLGRKKTPFIPDNKLERQSYQGAGLNRHQVNKSFQNQLTTAPANKEPSLNKQSLFTQRPYLSKADSIQGSRYEAGMSDEEKNRLEEDMFRRHKYANFDQKSEDKPLGGPDADGLKKFPYKKSDNKMEAEEGFDNTDNLNKLDSVGSLPDGPVGLDSFDKFRQARKNLQDNFEDEKMVKYEKKMLKENDQDYTQ